MVITSLSVIWSALVQMWLYVLSNAILSVGLLIVLIHLVMMFIDKVKSLIK